MHPDDLRAMLARALDGDLSPSEEAQLEAMMRRQPVIAAELERMALVREAGEADTEARAMEDEALDAMLKQGERYYSRPVTGVQELSGAVVRKAAGGKGFSIRHLLYVSGAAAACALFVFALNMGGPATTNNPGNGTGTGGPAANNSPDGQENTNQNPSPVTDKSDTSNKDKTPAPAPDSGLTLESAVAKWLSEAVKADYERMAKLAADDEKQNPEARKLIQQYPTLEKFAASRADFRAKASREELLDLANGRDHKLYVNESLALAAKFYIQAADEDRNGVLKGAELSIQRTVVKEVDTDANNELTIAEMDKADRTRLFTAMRRELKKQDAPGSTSRDADTTPSRGAPGSGSGGTSRRQGDK